MIKAPRLKTVFAAAALFVVALILACGESATAIPATSQPVAAATAVPTPTPAATSAPRQG